MSNFIYTYCKENMITPYLWIERLKGDKLIIYQWDYQSNGSKWWIIKRYEAPKIQIKTLFFRC